ncbi:DUF1189 domain-containing protein [Cytobacillus sp. IB215665]|uniref:DUF1189 domain-containing protein n=1 Tax=Cytobacillus sp. IB215665 TaxID=3097357 RepID=UPI002A140B77|nr:DUF1189 domain-containing protein [Cytobacillus sp. IB215665]MDX8364217.1 DUF1189 domain-containing protein [Cytobacillus sp. IB215665]
MSIFRQLVKSLYSTNDIAKFRFQGIGKTILYVFLLTLISIIPTAYFIASDISKGVNKINDLFESDLPSFYIEDGKLSIPGEEPILISKDDFSLIIDSRENISNNDAVNNIDGDGLALLKNRAVYVSNANEQSFYYSSFGDITFSSDDMQNVISTLDSLLIIIIPVFILIMYIFSSGMKFLGITLLAFIGMIINSVLTRKITYRHSWILSAYSVTIPTLFFTLMGTFNVIIPAQFTLNVIISVIILSLVIQQIPIPKK